MEKKVNEKKMIQKMNALWARIEASLVDDWRQVYRYASVQCATLLIGLNWAHDNIDLVQGVVPIAWMTSINMILGAAVIYFRITKQKRLHKEPDNDPEKSPQ